TFNTFLESRAMYQLGVARFKADSSRSAMNAFNHIVTKLPGTDIVDRSLYNLALAAYAIRLDDRAREAVKQLEAAYAGSPFAPRGALLVAEEYERAGSTTAAISGYKRILRSYPESGEAATALFDVIELLASNKKYADAIAVADTQLAKSATAPAPY